MTTEDPGDWDQSYNDGTLRSWETELEAAENWRPECLGDIAVDCPVISIFCPWRFKCQEIANVLKDDGEPEGDALNDAESLDDIESDCWGNWSPDCREGADCDVELSCWVETYYMPWLNED